MNKYGQLCYTYYLYHVPTGKKYYGFRWANRCEPENDLWTTYFGSSDLVDELVEAHGKDSFVAEVRKTFETKEEAFSWEQKVIDRLDAVKSPEWLNRSLANGNFYATGKHTQKTKNLLREISIRNGRIPPSFAGNKHTEEWCRNHSKFMRESGTSIGNLYGKNNAGKKRTTAVKEAKRIQHQAWCDAHPEAWNDETKQIAGKFSNKRWSRSEGIINFLLRNRWDLGSVNLPFILPTQRDARTKVPAIQLFPFISNTFLKHSKQTIHTIYWYSNDMVKMSNGGHGYTKKNPR